MELILGAFGVEEFGATVLASVTASVIGRAALGNVAFLDLPAFHVDHLAQYGLFALLGVVAAVVGVGFSRLLYLIEDACDWAWRCPEWLRPAAGGLALGVVLFVLPEMYGVGYPVLQKATAGGYAVGFLLLLLVGRMPATGLTIGTGGSGRVFAPSLFVGRCSAPPPNFLALWSLLAIAPDGADSSHFAKVFRSRLMARARSSKARCSRSGGVREAWKRLSRPPRRRA